MRHASKRAIRASIHASAREATLPSLPNLDQRAGFNPRLRTGGDERAALQGHRQARVSIHASAREATGQHLRGKDVLAVSIHASAREATGSGSAGPGDMTMFQSTPPHGRRPV